jgi:hypothetical protein
MRQRYYRKFRHRTTGMRILRIPQELMPRIAFLALVQTKNPTFADLRKVGPIGHPEYSLEQIQRVRGVVHVVKSVPFKC